VRRTDILQFISEVPATASAKRRLCTSQQLAGKTSMEDAEASKATDSGSQSVLDNVSLLGGRPASYVDGAYSKMYRADAGGPGCDIWVRPPCRM
jgi:hypothetical protein